MNLIKALAANAAHICQYGRDVVLTAEWSSDGIPACRGWGDQIVEITTDTDKLTFCLCAEHKTAIGQLTNAEDITTLETEVSA